MIMISPWSTKLYLRDDYLNNFRDFYMDSFVTNIYNVPKFPEWSVAGAKTTHEHLAAAKRSSTYY